MSSSDPHHEEEAGHERWLVSYADFITLMFAFFVVLYATSNKDLSKAKEFQESIKKYLIKGSMAGGAGAGGMAPQVNQAEKYNSVIESPLPTFKKDEKEIASALDTAEQLIEKSLTAEEKNLYLQDLISDEWGARISLKAEALFADGSDKIKKDAIPFMGKLARILSDSQRKLMIEGHVASGENGEFRSTWEFASARALTLLRFVQIKEKIPAGRLAALSLGESRPIFHNGNEKRNSRVDVILLSGDMEF
jgi:chemotaxis protein MotB